jgi:hypothetical protein
MANPTAPPNSGLFTTAFVVGGVYNANTPTLKDGQSCAFQFDINGNLKTTSSGGGGGGNVNITQVAGNTVAATTAAALPVELFDGTNAFGTSTNPLYAYADLLGQTSLPTAISPPAAVQPMGDKFGRAIVTLNAMRDIIGTVSVQTTNASSTTLITGIASTYADIITYIATNESSTATVISLSDGTTTYKYALAGNGGIVINFPTPLPAASTNTNWTVQSSVNSINVDHVAVYVKNK